MCVSLATRGYDAAAAAGVNGLYACVLYLHSYTDFELQNWNFVVFDIGIIFHVSVQCYIKF